MNKKEEVLWIVAEWIRDTKPKPSFYEAKAKTMKTCIAKDVEGSFVGLWHLIMDRFYKEENE